eukprot:6202772-Pleurochrysis_carterae.AAC.1
MPTSPNTHMRAEAKRCVAPAKPSSYTDKTPMRTRTTPAIVQSVFRMRITHPLALERHALSARVCPCRCTLRSCATRLKFIHGPKFLLQLCQVNHEAQYGVSLHAVLCASAAVAKQDSLVVPQPLQPIPVTGQSLPSTAPQSARSTRQ